MIEINYIFARMNPQKLKKEEQEYQKSVQEGYSSDQSEQYQQLDLCPLSQLEVSIPPKCPSPQQHKITPTYLDASIQCELQKSLHSEIEQLRVSLKEQIQKGVQLKQSNDSLLRKLKSIRQDHNLQQAQNAQYKKTTMIQSAQTDKLQKEANQLKQQILQKNKKINQFRAGFTAKLQQKKARELQIITIFNKFFNKQTQIYDEQTVNLLIQEQFMMLGRLRSLLCQIGVTLNQKQRQGKDISVIIQEKNKCFDFEEMLERTKKIQLGVYRLQSQATAHRQYCYKLEKQLEAMRESQGGTMKKWLDPVFKFCKIEEQPVGIEKKPKKKTTNSKNDLIP